MTYFEDADNPAVSFINYKDPDYPSKYTGPPNYVPSPTYYIDAAGNRIFTDDGGFGGGGTKSEKYKPDYGDYSDAAMDTVGYETDWKYPNWLIRMGQWRNF